MTRVDVTMVAHVPCGVCGYRQTTLRFSNVTVLATTLRENGPTLCWGLGRCDECSWTGDTRSAHTARFQMSDADWAKVQAARAVHKPKARAAA